MDNPRNVKEKLHNEKIIEDNNKLSVIAFNPNPIEKLSSDTPKANRIIPNLFNVISLLDGFMYSINICKDIKINIIPNTKLVFINK